MWGGTYEGHISDFVIVMKHHDQSNLQKEGVFGLPVEEEFIMVRKAQLQDQKT